MLKKQVATFFFKKKNVKMTFKLIENTSFNYTKHREIKKTTTDSNFQKTIFQLHPTISEKLKIIINGNEKDNFQSFLSYSQKKHKNYIFYVYKDALHLIFQKEKNRTEFLEILLKHIQEFDFSNNRIFILNRMIHYYKDIRNFDKAIEIFDYVLESTNQQQPNTYTFNLIIQIYHIRYISKSKEYFEMMINTYKLKPSIHSFHWMILGYLNEKNLPVSLKYFEMISEYDLKPNLQIIGSIISLYCNFKEIEDAIDFLETNYEKYLIKPDLLICTEILTCLLVFGLSGNNQRIISFFNDIETKYNVIPDKNMLDMYIRKLTEIGCTDIAIEYFEKMKNFYKIKPTRYTYESIISGLCSMKNMKEAVKYVNMMKKSNLKLNMNINRMMANAFLDLKQTAEASEYGANLAQLRTEFETKISLEKNSKTEISDRLSSLRMKLASKQLKK